MTKTAWIKHMKTVSHVTAPSLGGDRLLWNKAIEDHKISCCPDCKKRSITRTKEINRTFKEQAYKDCGLIKVRGPVSGKIYWE
jgi:hypothetical protein